MSNTYLRAAIEAAKAAEDIIHHYYHKGFEVSLKQDGSPVTVADVESEQAIRKVLSQSFPQHGFVGEETGKHALDADYLWLVDPIDGTKSFLRRSPIFSTQIALMHKGELVLGVSNAPLFGELACATVGGGAYLNGELLKVSDIRTLAQMTLSVGNIGRLTQASRWAEFGRLVAAVNRFRGYGDFLHYHMLAAGKLECVIESDINILDIAALAVIVREAGGVVSDLSGKPLDLNTTSILAANTPGIHGQVLKYLQPSE
jgi:histidinol-phosphatase